MIRSIITTFTAFVVVLFVLATCWQQLSPSNAKCTLLGGKYYLLTGCVPAPVFVLPLNLGSGE